MADKKISELDLALRINNDAAFPMSQDNAGEPTTFKASITQLATKIAEDMTYSNLQTTSKKLVGAINELLSLGSPIIIGTTAPTSSQGADGNIYVQYTAGTGGADDEVDGIFVKLDGAWCEISTGGSGTTDYEDLSNKPQVNSVELVGNKSLDDLGIMPASLSKTATGSLVHITDGGNDIPVKSLVSQIVAVESGNGEKSPENPYTISGFSQADISVMGKNIFNISTITASTRLVPTDGTTASSTASFISDYIPVKPTTIKVLLDYTSLDSQNERAWCFYDANKTFISSVVFNVTVRSQTITIPNGTSYMRCTFDNGNTDIRITFDLTATTYKAYNGNTYTFAFGQTVYGGYFDNNGNLVITHGVIDLSQISTGGTAGSGYVWYTTLNNPKTVPNTEIAPIISEKYNEIRFNAVSSTVNSIAIRDNGVLYVNNGSNTIQPSGIAVYELANPITLSITSQDIPTLLGENNIFSNCGDVEVNYYTDNADEIVEVVEATASTPLHNYSTDEQVIGTWIDGSPIYEKTFDLGSDINISYDSWTETSISWQTLNVNRLVGAEGSMSSGGTFAGTLLSSKKSNGNIEIQTPRNGTATGVRYLTLRYTKSV